MIPSHMTIFTHELFFIILYQATYQNPVTISLVYLRHKRGCGKSFKVSQLFLNELSEVQAVKTDTTENNVVLSIAVQGKQKHSNTPTLINILPCDKHTASCCKITLELFANISWQTVTAVNTNSPLLILLKNYLQWNLA